MTPPKWDGVPRARQGKTENWGHAKRLGPQKKKRTGAVKKRSLRAPPVDVFVLLGTGKQTIGGAEKEGNQRKPHWGDLPERIFH